MSQKASDEGSIEWRVFDQEVPQVDPNHMSLTFTMVLHWSFTMEVEESTSLSDPKTGLRVTSSRAQTCGVSSLVALTVMCERMTLRGRRGQYDTFALEGSWQIPGGLGHVLATAKLPKGARLWKIRSRAGALGATPVEHKLRYLRSAWKAFPCQRPPTDERRDHLKVSSIEIQEHLDRAEVRDTQIPTKDPLCGGPALWSVPVVMLASAPRVDEHRRDAYLRHQMRVYAQLYAHVIEASVHTPPGSAAQR